MSSVLVVTLGLWVGCLIAEACDDFRSTKRIIREMVRQWTWVLSKVGVKS